MRPFIVSAGDRVRLRRRILEQLKPGKQSAVTGKRLAWALNEADDRHIRIVIRELIKEGYAIASSVSEPAGFYLVANENEAFEYIRVLQDRINEDKARLDDFKEACADFAIPEQQSLFSGAGR